MCVCVYARVCVSVCRGFLLIFFLLFLRDYRRDGWNAGMLMPSMNYAWPLQIMKTVSATDRFPHNHTHTLFRQSVEQLVPDSQSG